MQVEALRTPSLTRGVTYPPDEHKNKHNTFSIFQGLLSGAMQLWLNRAVVLKGFRLCEVSDSAEIFLESWCTMGAALVTVPTTAILWKFITGTSRMAHCRLVPAWHLAGSRATTVRSITCFIYSHATQCIACLILIIQHHGVTAYLFLGAIFQIAAVSSPKFFPVRHSPRYKYDPWRHPQLQLPSA